MICTNFGVKKPLIDRISGFIIKISTFINKKGRLYKDSPLDSLTVYYYLS